MGNKIIMLELDTGKIEILDRSAFFNQNHHAKTGYWQDRDIGQVSIL
jgi:hypothetical protein